MDKCVNFYVTSTGSLRLTYSSSREAVMYLLEAKRKLNHEHYRHVHVQIMCSPEKVETMKDLLAAGRELKSLEMMLF